jgi:hypothetical protein
MKEQVSLQPNGDKDVTMSDPLTAAAELAAVAQAESAHDVQVSDSHGDDNSDSEDEGEIAELDTASLPDEGPQRKKAKLGAKSRRTKRKRETGFHNVKNDQQMAEALAKQARRKVARQEKKAAKKMAKAVNAAPSAD